MRCQSLARMTARTLASSTAKHDTKVQATQNEQNAWYHIWEEFDCRCLIGSPAPTFPFSAGEVVFSQPR